MTQNESILSYMSKEPIDAKTAISLFGCYRLAARINDLRNDGHLIETITVHTGKGKRYARYVLLRRKQ